MHRHWNGNRLRRGHWHRHRLWSSVTYRHRLNRNRLARIVRLRRWIGLLLSGLLLPVIGLSIGNGLIWDVLLRTRPRLVDGHRLRRLHLPGHGITAR